MEKKNTIPRIVIHATKVGNRNVDKVSCVRVPSHDVGPHPQKDALQVNGITKNANKTKVLKKSKASHPHDGQLCTDLNNDAESKRSSEQKSARSSEKFRVKKKEQKPKRKVAGTNITKDEVQSFECVIKSEDTSDETTGKLQNMPILTTESNVSQNHLNCEGDTSLDLDDNEGSCIGKSPDGNAVEVPKETLKSGLVQHVEEELPEKANEGEVMAPKIKKESVRRRLAAKSHGNKCQKESLVDCKDATAKIKKKISGKSTIPVDDISKLLCKGSKYGAFVATSPKTGKSKAAQRLNVIDQSIIDLQVLKSLEPAISEKQKVEEGHESEKVVEDSQLEVVNNAAVESRSSSTGNKNVDKKTKLPENGKAASPGMQKRSNETPVNAKVARIKQEMETPHIEERAPIRRLSLFREPKPKTETVDSEALRQNNEVGSNQGAPPKKMDFKLKVKEEKVEGSPVRPVKKSVRISKLKPMCYVEK